MCGLARPCASLERGSTGGPQPVALSSDAARSGHPELPIAVRTGDDTSPHGPCEGVAVGAGGIVPRGSVPRGRQEG